MVSKKTSHTNKLKIGISIGDINGIGPEILIKTLSDNRMVDLFTPVIYGSTKTLSYYRKLFNANDFNYSQVKSDRDFHSKKINVVNCWEDAIQINAGEITAEAGNCSRLALSRAAVDLKEGFIDGLVTLPIAKENIKGDEFPFNGHTDYLAHTFDQSKFLMMMVSEALKVGLVTDHVSLKDVSKVITKDLFKNKLEILEKTLKRDFGISKPKIAVLGINPHAGENGLLGDEESTILQPVIKDKRQHGSLVYGPFPSDGYFGNYEFKKYDATLAMYHDQGLIPFKTISFEEGVNFTAGLPAVRTSPDHGTAFSIAGKNQADNTSFRSSLFLAMDIIQSRIEYAV